jgi:hypothetical protein
MTDALLDSQPRKYELMLAEAFNGWQAAKGQELVSLALLGYNL